MSFISLVGAFNMLAGGISEPVALAVAAAAFHAT
jgi:hypothetical protein